jgi:two-component system cell cycle sensor histidine kinase/response regulator CckA
MAEDADRRRAPPLERRRSLLIVDDDASLTTALARGLREHSFVSVASDGDEALRLIEASQDTFDAVLSDVQMPGLSGIELHRALDVRCHPAAGRFVLMTGGALTQAERAYVRARSIPLLAKPFGIAAVEDLLLLDALAQGRRTVG